MPLHFEEEEAESWKSLNDFSSAIDCVNVNTGTSIHIFRFQFWCVFCSNHVEPEEEKTKANT